MIRTVDGRPVRVGDVAEVVDGWEDVRYLAEVNGFPSITVGIQKQSGANTVDVARRLRAEVERINGERKDIHLTVFSDSSEFIRQSIDNVEQNAYWGSLLALADPVPVPAQPDQHRHHRGVHPGVDHRLLRAAVFRRPDAEPDDLRRAGAGGGDDGGQRHRRAREHRPQARGDRLHARGGGGGGLVARWPGRCWRRRSPPAWCSSRWCSCNRSAARCSSRWRWW